MRIMHIALGGCLSAPPVSYGLTEDTGGHIAYVLGAAMAQAQRYNTQVTILTRAFDAPALGAIYSQPEERIAPNCTIRRLRSARADYLSKDALEAELPSLTRAFLALLDESLLPDVIHAHFGDAAQLAIAAEARFGIPWVYSSHSLGHEKADGAQGPALLRRIARETEAARRAHAIIASSRDEAERQLPTLSTESEGRIHRVPPGIGMPAMGGTARARALISPFLRDGDKPVILAIARPIVKKNLAALVEAYAAAPDLRARANLVIVAGLRHGLKDADPEKETVIRGLFDAVDRHGLWGHVALPARHRPHDIPALYALAAEGGVFCNPAHHEPFGLTLIEAAQAGVPVVATSNGGPSDIIDTIGLGSLVDPADPRSIAQGLREMLDLPDRSARVAAARDKASAAFDWDAWATRLETILRGIGAPARPRGPAARPRHLLACDIDGTLTGSPEGARQFESWANTRPATTAFVVATGRSLPEARRVLADWQISAPRVMITSVGTEIWRQSSAGGYCLCEDWATRMDRDWNRDGVLTLARASGLSLQAPCDQRRWKISLFGRAPDAHLLRIQLEARGIAVRVIASHDRFIDVLPVRAGKAGAIAFEAARSGLGPSACVVAGDSGNDEDMLRGFASAILPANALPELDGVTGAYRSCLAHADGVLDGLRHFGLAGAPTPAALVAE